MARGRNLEVIYRWGSNDTGKMRAYAVELVALNPDAIFAAPSAALAEVQRATRTIPIVLPDFRFSSLPLAQSGWSC
jgi:hypothetical protein